MARAPVETFFTAADYAVFGVMLLLSLLIGVFYAIKDRKSEDGVQGYLLGGRNVSYLPVAMSLSLSFVSAVTILGIPAEIYVFGSMYFWLVLTCVVVIPVCTEIYIPLFYRLQVTSSFEYLQLRYNYGVRLLGTAAYILQNIMYLGVMIYAPAVALEAVTQFNLWAAICSIGLVCTIYTTLGGLKAVIWSDVFQGIVVLVGMFLTMFGGASGAGGWSNVWERCWEGQRIDFVHFETDPKIRHTFWSLVVGLGILWVSIFATSQSQVQRYLCCATEADAKKGFLLSMAISAVLITLSTLSGWSMYAYFYDCDPLRNKEIGRADQLLPYMVLSIFNEYPGLPGLFVAGVFAGCLSTVSSGINAMACVTIQDFIRPFVSWKEKTLTWWSKGLVFLYGILCVAFACLSTLLGNVLQASLSVLGIVGGPLLGLFTIGVVFPFGNSYGAASGLILGIAFSSWLYIGSQQLSLAVKLPYLGIKPVSVNGCVASNYSLALSSEEYGNETTESTTSVFGDSQTNVYTLGTALNVEMSTDASDIDSTSAFPPLANFYLLSYAYYTAFGFAISLGFGLLVSLLTCGHRHASDLNPNLVIPLVDHKLFCWLPLSFKKMMWCGVKRGEIAQTNVEVVDFADQESGEISKKSNEKGEENMAYVNVEDESTSM